MHVSNEKANKKYFLMLGIIFITIVFLYGCGQEKAATVLWAVTAKTPLVMYGINGLLFLHKCHQQCYNH